MFEAFYRKKILWRLKTPHLILGLCKPTNRCWWVAGLTGICLVVPSSLSWKMVADELKSKALITSLSIEENREAV